jgi:hypothetical protein
MRARVPARRARRIVRLRRSAIAKIIALWFVAMIVLPFTAPFQSYELAGSSSSSSQQALPKDKGGSDDKLVPPPESSLLPPATHVVVIERLTHSDQVDHHPVHHAVLRL